MNSDMKTPIPNKETLRSFVQSHYDIPPKAFVRSYGCQQNANDGEKLRGVLAQMGYAEAAAPEEADVVVFNTCAVREHAEQRVFGNLGALKPLKDKNPRLLIAVCGCMPQQASVVEKLRASYPYVDIAFGVGEIEKLPQLIYQKLSGAEKRVLLQPGEAVGLSEDLPIRRESAYKAYLPIMYGCDNFCSYCIVPYVRGRERSREPQAVLAEMRQLAKEGYKEITLLGQNVNSYGKGLDRQIDFADLLGMLAEVEGDFRLRFMTSHPKDATQKLFDTMAAHPKICNHLHLPVQSGSDAVLQQMNRRYTAQHYLSLIAAARKTVPGITFSSDIIVGFPGESEADFAATLELVNQVRFNQLFTFIYSKRSGTKAAEMPDETPHKVKTDRMAALLAVQEEIQAKQLQNLVGQRLRVLAEGEGKLPGTAAGRSCGNTMVHFPAKEAQEGAFFDIIVKEATRTYLIGQAPQL